MLATMDWDELRRWTASAAVAVALHATAVALLVRWQEPIVGDEGTDAVVVDLEPFASPPSDSKQDIAPGPEQEQIEPSEESQPSEQTKVEEKVEPTPSVPNADVTLPEETTEPDAPKKEVTPPVPEATAPPPPRPSAAQVTSWQRKIAAEIERHKRYPAAARERREIGVTQLAFTIDRQGMVVASRVLRSSGYAALDQEAIATAQRAQPFPPPPLNLLGATFEFSVPIRFKLQ
jgi:protein TonB